MAEIFAKCNWQRAGGNLNYFTVGRDCLRLIKAKLSWEEEH